MSGRTAILVTCYPGQPSRSDLERLAARDLAPRRDYVELARLLDADVVDSEYMATRAGWAPRGIARAIGAVPGQVAEGFLARRRYGTVLAWTERLGLPLALLYKLARADQDLVMIAVWLSESRKTFLLRRLKAHSHIRAIVGRSLQMRIAAERLGVPARKLHVEAQAVDDRFWRPQPEPVEDLICAVGQEARDYRTLLRAVEGLDLEVELAIATISTPPTQATAVPAARALGREALPANVRAWAHEPRGLRRLYSRSRFAVVPLNVTEYDPGVTATVEAMAMGKAVITTSTPGNRDLLVDGVHGIYVPPGDARALRGAIEHLGANPGEAERMGRAGRALVEERHRLDARMEFLAGLVRRSESTG